MKIGTVLPMFAVLAVLVHGERPVPIVRFHAGRFRSAGEAVAFYSMGPQLQGPTNAVVWRAPLLPVRKPDPSATFRGVLMRAESGSLSAMKELAGLYRSGTGTETNSFEARVWELRAEAAEKVSGAKRRDTAE
jgi:hypothetical protein